MSRLHLCPPHLMDMPFVNDSRIPPSGLSYGETLGFNPGEIPGIVANFANWDGTLDGAEQTHEDSSIFDFDNYYPDEEFWGAQIIDAGNIRIIRKAITNNGQLTQVSSQTIAISGAGVATAANRTQLYSANCMMAEVCRLNATTFCLVGWFYRDAAAGYQPGVLSFSFDGTNFTYKSFVGNGNLQTSDPAQAGIFSSNPVAYKLTENSLFVAMHNSSAQTSSTVQITYANISTNFINTTNFAVGNNSTWGHTLFLPISPTRFMINYWQEGAPNVVSLFSQFEHAYTDTSNSAASFSRTANVYGASGDYGGDTGTSSAVRVSRKVFALLTPTLLVQYAHATQTLELWQFAWATSPVKLSSLPIASVTTEDVISFARLSPSEIMIVARDATVSSRARTSRVRINADNSMSIFGSALNYTGLPNIGSAGSPESANLARQKNRGLVLPGNRVLMQATKYPSNATVSSFYPGRQQTKLLRAA